MHLERKISFHDLNESKSLPVNHLLKKLYFWILCLSDERLFQVGVNSRLSAYSNKYGTKSIVYILISPDVR